MCSEHTGWERAGELSVTQTVRELSVTRGRASGDSHAKRCAASQKGVSRAEEQLSVPRAAAQRVIGWVSWFSAGVPRGATRSTCCRLVEQVVWRGTERAREAACVMSDARMRHAWAQPVPGGLSAAHPRCLV